MKRGIIMLLAVALLLMLVSCEYTDTGAPSRTPDVEGRVIDKFITHNLTGSGRHIAIRTRSGSVREIVIRRDRDYWGCEVGDCVRAYHDHLRESWIFEKIPCDGE
jgi:hypothetical protein